MHLAAMPVLSPLLSTLLQWEPQSPGRFCSKEDKILFLFFTEIMTRPDDLQHIWLHTQITNRSSLYCLSQAKPELTDVETGKRGWQPRCCLHQLRQTQLSCMKAGYLLIWMPATGQNVEPTRWLTSGFCGSVPDVQLPCPGLLLVTISHLNLDNDRRRAGRRIKTLRKMVGVRTGVLKPGQGLKLVCHTAAQEVVPERSHAGAGRNWQSLQPGLPLNI